MVLHGSAWFYMVLHVLHGSTWFYMVLHGSTWFYLFFFLQVAVGFGAGLSELLHSEPESRMEREEVGHHWE